MNKAQNLSRINDFRYNHEVSFHQGFHFEQ